MRIVQPGHSWTGSCLRVITFVVIILAVLSGCVSGGVFLKNGTDISGNDTIEKILADANTTPGDYSIEFFYNIHCGACHLAMAYLNEYQAAHPDVTINSYDLYNSSENKVIFEHYKSEYNRTYVSVPSVFIGNAGLEGESAIRANFDPLVTWYTKDRKSNTSISNSTLPRNGAKTHRNVISIPLVLIAGLIDGINPCAVAILLFLLVFLMFVRERQRIILTGAVFTSAIFFSYFISGTGIFPLSATSGIVKIFSIGAVILAVLGALFFFMEAFFPGKMTGRIVSGDKKEELKAACGKLAIPIGFIAGLLLGVLVLPCAGGIYISIIDMIAFRVNIARGLVYLVLYNLAFIIPLILITIIVYLAMKPEEENEEERISEKVRNTRIFSGLLLLVFAFLVLTGLL